MSDPTFCYWSVADGKYADMMTTCIASARAVGVAEEFHVYTDKQIPGAECHPSGNYAFRNYLFKFDFLKTASSLGFDYLVFIDADNFFVRHPGDVIASTRGAPVHVVLESDCAKVSNVRPDWWGCPLGEYVRLMRESGVRSRAVYNTNAGFWIVHCDVVDQMIELAMGFWNQCKAQGYEFTEEAPLAYAGHMLMGNPYAHVLESNANLWASDWTGVYANRIPDGRNWQFEDYMDGRRFNVNPAIVHCMRSKEALIARANDDSFRS